MGQEVDAREFTREDRTRYRAKVRRCLDVFEQMLSDHRFEAEANTAGIEIELNLVDDDGAPALNNLETLEAIADPDFQTELGAFNVEINVPPHQLAGDGLAAFESGIRDDLNEAEAKATKVGSHMLMVGILPSLEPGHMTADTITPNPRYALLSEQILAARGEDISLNIDGADHLQITADTIIPEAACTSTQLHLQVGPEEFAPYWNASQAIAGVQLAVGANSPFLLGRRLWHETRVALFEQATDTRSEELKAQGVRPRVWFGERWITSIFDLFEENVRYFPALLPILEDEDPAELYRRGETPTLGELRLHNGTIYRWNRPVYDVVGDLPHLRVENRTLPAGPTVVDTMANAAFYFGLVRALVDADRPLWSQMSFSAAEENFHVAAQHGIESQMYWPGLGPVPATELVLRRLLPLAYEGLDSFGVAPTERDRLLGIIEQRCLRGVNGASWQLARFEREYQRSGRDRFGALRKTVLAYRELMHANLPVHEWE